MKCDPNAPALPTPFIDGLNVEHTRGMTKRELFAAMAMQGILANPEPQPDFDNVARVARQHADRIIAELNA